MLRNTTVVRAAPETLGTWKPKGRLAVALQRASRARDRMRAELGATRSAREDTLRLMAWCIEHLDLDRGDPVLVFGHQAAEAVPLLSHLGASAHWLLPRSSSSAPSEVRVLDGGPRPVRVRTMPRGEAWGDGVRFRAILAAWDGDTIPAAWLGELEPESPIVLFDPSLGGGGS